MLTVLKLPQLNNPIVCREHLYAIVVWMSQEFKRVNLLIKFKTLQVIEFWLVWLNFWEVPVVEVAWIFQICVSENNDAAAFVTHSEVLTSLVKFDRGENVGIINVRSLTLSQSINIDPISRLDGLWVGAVLCHRVLRTGVWSRVTHWDYNMLVARWAWRSSHLYIVLWRTAAHLDFFCARATGAASAWRHTRVIEHVEHFGLKLSFWIVSILLLNAELVNHLAIYHYLIFQ